MNSHILDIAIGLVFIFTLYSLLVTIINEIVSTMFSLRARLLAKAIQRMLEEESQHYWQYLFLYRFPHAIRSIRIYIYNVFPVWKGINPGKSNQTFSDEFYQSPVIKYMGEGKVFHRPAYISASTFSKTLVELLQQKGAALKGASSELKAEDIRLFLENNSDIISPQMRNSLFALLKTMKNDMDKFRNLLSGEITDDQRKKLLLLLNTTQGDAEKFKTALNELAIPQEASQAILSFVDKANTHIAVLRSLLEAGSFSNETRQVLVSACSQAKTNAELFRRLIERGNVSTETRQMLLSMLNESKASDGKDDIEKFRGLIEKWFNEMMDRTKGWYKRKTKWATFGIGMILAVTFNVNTLEIVNRLSVDKTVAKQVADLATTYAETNKGNPLLLKHKKDSTDAMVIDTVSDKAVRDTIKSLLTKSKTLLNKDIASTDNLMGLGWNFRNDTVDIKIKSTGFFSVFKRPFHVFMRDISIIRQKTSKRDWLGFLLTALAISLGAPFWFDLLSKLVQLRGTGDDTDKKQKSQAPAPGSNQ